ncbi:hypothetical protein [Streptomyces mirabilis]
MPADVGMSQVDGGRETQHVTENFAHGYLLVGGFRSAIESSKAWRE